MDDNQRFLRFLATRGIRRVSIPQEAARRLLTAQNYTHEELGDQYQVEFGGRVYTVPNGSDESFHTAMRLEMSESESDRDVEQGVVLAEQAIDDSSEGSADDDGEDIIDFLSFTRNNEDADRFYQERRESFNTSTLVEDRDVSDTEASRYEYFQTTKASFLSEESRISEIESVYSNLVTHNEQTAYEIKQVPPASIDYENGVGNGGVYNPENPDLTTIHYHDFASITNEAPAAKVKDPLQLTYRGFLKFSNRDSARKYKNNLSCIIRYDCNDYMVTAVNSELLLYAFDPISSLPYQRHVLKFDTKPSLTTTTDRLISTWPYFPHTINYMKTFDWLGEETIGVCLDDGSLMIWHTKTIGSFLQKFGTNKVEALADDNYVDNRFFGLKIAPDFKLKLESSCWGLDATAYTDNEGNASHLLVCSDNSQSVTLFYYSTFDGKMYHCKTHQVLHNVPNVGFADVKIVDDMHHVKVNCCSISGELIVFQFKFRINHGPINAPENQATPRDATYYVDPTMQQLENTDRIIEHNPFPRVGFFQPRVINRALLTEDCWTVNRINKSFFKHVDSIRAVFSSHDIDEAAEVRRIVNESLILNLIQDPKKSNELGLSSRFQFFRVPVLVLNEEPIDSTRLTTRDDDYRRVNKVYNKTRQRFRSQEYIDDQDEDFLVISTSKKVGLFSQDSLFCHCSTPTVFTLTLPFSDDSKFSNRISISAIIPQLACYIAVSQQGLVSVFRLCQHRGVFGMRQEYIFPNAISLNNGIRTISGLSVRDMSVAEQMPRFYIYIVYTDGLVLTYEMCDNQDVDLMGANFG